MKGIVKKTASERVYTYKNVTMRDLFTCNSLVLSLICNDHVTKKRRAMVTRIVIFKQLHAGANKLEPGFRGSGFAFFRSARCPFR